MKFKDFDEQLRRRSGDPGVFAAAMEGVELEDMARRPCAVCRHKPAGSVVRFRLRDKYGNKPNNVPGSAVRFRLRGGYGSFSWTIERNRMVTMPLCRSCDKEKQVVQTIGKDSVRWLDL
jgi:hypothetical protein